MKHERNNLMKRSLEKWGHAPIILGVLVEHPLFWECSSSTHFLGGHKHSSFKGAQALIVWRIAKQRTIEQMQNGHERNKFMKCSLEKMRACTHYFWGLEHPLFWGLEHSSFRRARALTIQRGTSTHCSKTNKQRASEQLQSGHERNKFMKCFPEKMGARAPIIFGGSTSTHYFRRARRALIFKRARAPIIQRAFN